MKLELNLYADNGILSDPGDAVFVAKIIRQKFSELEEINFEGVTSVSDGYLDNLFESVSPEELEDKLNGLGNEVNLALGRWVKRQSEPPPAEGKKLRPKKKTKNVVKQVASHLKFRAPNLEGERYSPTRLTARLRSQLTRYIESAYPLSDPILVRARRLLLEQDKQGRLLAQEPYIETTSRYAAHDGDYSSLDLPGGIAGFFSRLAATKRSEQPEDGESTILFPRMYRHQAKVLESFLAEGKDVIVATGTGSGKTECFLLPMLGTIYREAAERPNSFRVPGIRAIILYPMNALVNDQLARLRNLFGDPKLAECFHELGENTRHPLFGMYTGRTPYPGARKASKDGERVAPILDYYLEMEPEIEKRIRHLGRYPAKDLKQFYAKELEEEAVYKSGPKAGQAYTKHHWKQRLHTQPGDRELLTRHEMVQGAGSRPGQAPDILVTNYSMLEYMLIRPFERPIFEQTRKWLAEEGNQFLLVVDEAHMYRGSQGAEVGFLLRRLRSRLGISNRPDKLRVICTSASVGSGAAAMKNIRNFAADLSGKRPEDFVPIEGSREVPPAGPAPQPQIAETLASIDLDALHAAAKPGQLRNALAPFFRALGRSCDRDDESGILAHLNEVLGETPLINCLLRETAGHARSLTELAESMFPGLPSGRKALEVLITLGSIARQQEGEPGLVPTRVHAMFRGLHALYACVNPLCGGRQDSPGKAAMLGKLFTEPVAVCDACGCRVFEIASCRSCGSPYLIGYCPDNQLPNLPFVWGETEGSLQTVQMLPTPPRYAQSCEEIRFHLNTGFLDARHDRPDDEVRSLWLSLDRDGRRQHAFNLCAMCQAPDTRTPSRISDFRTKGEQPFTALIESQFAEQAPQNNDERLPNRGRKVLVFSDGRQKAARLAPALEHSHARDVFRQVLILAAHELKKQTEFEGMDKLYPAVIWVCNDRGINLFPSPDEREFHQQLYNARDRSLAELIERSNMGHLRPTESYAVQLFSELTDRYYSLASLALATVEEDPLVRCAFDDAPDLGISKDMLLSIYREWVRLQLEFRRFIPPGADISRFGDKVWERPEGIDPDNASQLLPGRFPAYLERVLPDADKVPVFSTWLRNLIRTSNLFDLLNDRYFLKPQGLCIRLRMDQAWLRCRDCSRLYAETLDSTCPFCLGETVATDPAYLDARTGFYRSHIQQASDRGSLEPFGLIAAEHTAQLTGYQSETPFNKTEEYELRFQDIFLENQPPIDVLSCTTTMEVGIDIGSLSGIALRNVPPQVANYQQRAGRAGRRGRSVASVVTYAHGSSHDSYFYSAPDRIISGEVLTPIVYIENQQILSRHVNAYLLQRFFHDQVAAQPGNFRLFEALGTVEEFLTDETVCSLAKLETWLNGNRQALESELDEWAPRHSFGFNKAVAGIEKTISGAVSSFLAALRRSLPIEEFEQREMLEGLARDSLEKVLEEQLLDLLLARAVLPRYAFPTDVVNFWVAEPKRPGDPPHQRKFEYEPSRDLQIALSEYAPGASLTIDKWRLTSEALYSPYDPDVGQVLDKREPYTACANCGWVSLSIDAQQVITCPICGSDALDRQFFVIPRGFAPDINEKKKIDQGDGGSVGGQTTKAQLEVGEPPAEWDVSLYGGRLSLLARDQRLVMVNKSIGNRGFMICPDCGRAEPVFGPGFTKTKLFKAGIPIQHKHPLENGVICTGRGAGPFFLGHRFPTDVLLFRIALASPVECPTTSPPARSALTSLVEAISLAASRALQIDEGELSGNWTPITGSESDPRAAYFFLYDLLPGGAGYTRLVLSQIETVLDETEKLLGDCDCASSCYQCLRHYGNNYNHASLDRHLAYALLRYFRYGERPTLSAIETNLALSSLEQFCQLSELKCDRGAIRNGVEIPFIVERADGAEIWAEVRHPLINGASYETDVCREAQSNLVEYCSVDAYTIIHDLPAAVSRLQI